MERLNRQMDTRLEFKRTLRWKTHLEFISIRMTFKAMRLDGITQEVDIRREGKKAEVEKWANWRGTIQQSDGPREMEKVFLGGSFQWHQMLWMEGQK